MKPFDYLLCVVTLAVATIAIYRTVALEHINPRQVAVIEHSGSGEWIQVRCKGNVVGEYQPRDGEIYQMLEGWLHDE